MPSFYVPARDSRHRASCFALYRALLRLVPRIILPDELTSRPGWINPIRYLISSGFRRNKTDTSPRLVTSALKSGYRFLALLARAQDASSPQHAEVLAFLHQRQANFPPPRPPAEPEPEPERPRAPPLLTKVSSPGEPPVYQATVRPLPLEQLRGGKRKVPVFDETNCVGFLRVGKPQSHWHAYFLRRKTDRRQARIEEMQELSDAGRRAAAAEDLWEELVAGIAREEGVPDELLMDEFEDPAAAKDFRGLGPHERVVREFGVGYLAQKLGEEAADVMARTTAMLDLVEAEKKLAEEEKREKKERRRKAWEERQNMEQEQRTEELQRMEEPQSEEERQREGQSMEEWRKMEAEPHRMEKPQSEEERQREEQSMEEWRKMEAELQRMEKPQSEEERQREGQSMEEWRKMEEELQTSSEQQGREGSQKNGGTTDDSEPSRE